MINCFAGDEADEEAEAPAKEAKEVPHWAAKEAKEVRNYVGKIYDKEIYIFTNMT